VTTSTIAERVAAGAAWLDANRPGWVERIDLETLDLGDPCRCIVGQLNVQWGGLKIADDPRWHAASLGFDTWLAEGYEYSALTAAWRQLIIARRVLAA
jgi:hypothetical protein